MAEDQLIRDLDVPAADATPAIIDLELDGRIERHAGGLLALAMPETERPRSKQIAH